MEDYQRAITDYAQALDIEPEHSDVWYALADSQFNVGHTAEALSSYERALSLHPTDTECWFDYGSTLLDQGAVVEALQAFMECIRLQPDWAEGYYAVAKTLCAAGQPVDSIPYLRSAFQRDARKRTDFEQEFPGIAGPLGMEYLYDMLQRQDSSLPPSQQ